MNSKAVGVFFIIILLAILLFVLNPNEPWDPFVHPGKYIDMLTDQFKNFWQ